jgi:hypothetical protein
MMRLDDILERWIPYRLQAIETFQFAWNWIGESELPRKVVVLVDGHEKLRGNVAAVTNPMIDAGIIHARALLEFLGLCARDGHLAQVSKRRAGDVAVEQYSTPERPLTMASPDTVFAAYPGPRAEDEEALVSVFELANKLMAHITDGAVSREWTDQHLDIALRGIPVLVHNHLYAKLGRRAPSPSQVLPHGC